MVSDLLHVKNLGQVVGYFTAARTAPTADNNYKEFTVR